MKKIIVLISVLMVGILLSACLKVKISNTLQETETEIAKDEKGDNKMDNFSCETNKGETFELYSRNNNKPVFINFWATWCGPCVGEMPDLQDVYDEYKDKVDFIFINCGDSKEIISSFLNDMEGKYTFPIGYDESDELALKFNVTGIPTTYVLNSDNTISDMVVGARSGDEYRKLLSKVINK